MIFSHLCVYVFSSAGFIRMVICMYSDNLNVLVTVLPSVLLTVFNVGNYRREAVGAKQTSDFFNPQNKDAMLMRK